MASSLLLDRTSRGSAQTALDVVDREVRELIRRLGWTRSPIPVPSACWWATWSPTTPSGRWPRRCRRSVTRSGWSATCSTASRGWGAATVAGRPGRRGDLDQRSAHRWVDGRPHAGRRAARAGCGERGSPGPGRSAGRYFVQPRTWPGRSGRREEQRPGDRADVSLVRDRDRDRDRAGARPRRCDRSSAGAGTELSSGRGRGGPGVLRRPSRRPAWHDRRGPRWRARRRGSAATPGNAGALRCTAMS